MSTPPILFLLLLSLPFSYSDDLFTATLSTDPYAATLTLDSNAPALTLDPNAPTLTLDPNAPTLTISQVHSNPKIPTTTTSTIAPAPSTPNVPTTTTTSTISSVPLNPNSNTTTPKNGNYQFIAREFLSSHNKVRTILGQPSFKWNRKLARHARSWSDQRKGDCELIHSGNDAYGENMFWGEGWTWKAEDAVMWWANEHLYYDYDSNSCEADKVCGHFTQMAWNSTVMIGCGRTECDDGGVIITCNYSPPGNYMGEKPF